MADFSDMDATVLAQQMYDAVASSRLSAQAQADAAYQRVSGIRAAYRSGTLGQVLEGQLKDLKNTLGVTDGNGNTGSDPASGNGSAGPNGAGGSNPRSG